MSADAATLDILLAELRELAVTIAPVSAHLATIDAQLAELPKSAEVDELRKKVEALELGFADLKAFRDGPPPLPQRLIELEDAYRKFVEATGISEASIIKTAGSAGDTAHREMARSEAAPMILESEQRTEAQLVPMRQRMSELAEGAQLFAKVLRENQSAVLVLTGVAALVLAGLVLVLVSAFGSPLP